MIKSIHTEIDIDADVTKVWDVLADVSAYEKWNPYHVSVVPDGDVAAGTRLRVTLNKPNGDVVKIKPQVLRVLPGRELTWGGGIKGVFVGEHRFVLEPLPSGTRLIQSEEFRGFGVRYAGLDTIAEGYELMNQALKAIVESASDTADRLATSSPSEHFPGL